MPLSTEGPTSGKTGWGRGGGGVVRLDSGGTTLSVLRPLSQVKLVGVGGGLEWTVGVPPSQY